jgi:hypothetical protein
MNGARGEDGYCCKDCMACKVSPVVSVVAWRVLDWRSEMNHEQYDDHGSHPCATT